MAQPGLLSWANSIRLTMASDPGRQVFKDQVQTHGFLFLDDYLDNIVSGAKQDPLIELVKTPGRKKAIARKPKLMSSKLGNTVTSLSFEGINENSLPTNTLQAALPPSKLTGHSSDNSATPPVQQPRPPLVPILVSSNAPTNLEYHTSIQSLATRNSSLLPALGEHNDLSIIAEDEEPFDRSRASTSGPVESRQQPLGQIDQIDVSNPPKSSLVPEAHHDISMASASSAATFQSIPLESPKAMSPDIEETVHVHDGPLHSPHESPVIPNVTEPVLSESSRESIDQIMAETQEDVDPKSNDRPIALSFPTLPEPMPLRKSMKPSRDPSLVMQGAATPGAAISGKRTSWLMKAREVKALETTSKKHVPSINFFSGLPITMPQGIKRKSGDRLTSDQGDLVHEEEERLTKVAKTAEDDVAPRKSKDIQISMTRENHLSPITQPVEEVKPPANDDPIPEGVLDRLKKTVEGFGIRVSGKTLNKSLGGEAVTALAEARAAAEARVAERDRKEDEMTMAISTFTPAAPKRAEAVGVEPQAVVESSSGQKNSRLSVSDLFPSEGRVKEKHKVPEKPFQFKPILSNPTASSGSRQSTSTTPPNSPPPHVNSVHLSLAPVFNKPPPVFAPPPQITSKVITPPSLQATVFSPPPRSFDSAHPHNIYSHPSLSHPKVAGTLTAQSTLESVQSDQIFDHDDDEPAWMPQTQDTDYTSGYTQTQPLTETQICDEDDSWPMDEKLAAGVQWTFGGSKEDSMTWSTLPSQSQRGDTGPVTKTSSTDGPFDWNGSPKRNPIPGAFDDDADNMVEDQEDLAGRDAELKDVVLKAPKTANVDMELKSARPQSQMSMASFDSSQTQQSHGGFLNQASKLLSSALGTNKKQSEVKLVLQKAAVAAKKQQEEADKKAARLKEMESRRQQALQRKAEEERARVQEEERKMKDEAERRKKEKEGNTEKRALKLPAGKKDEEAQKKRKIELEKKPELKKPTQSILFGKSHLKSSVKQASTLNSSFAFSSLAAAGSSSNLEAESSKAKEHANQQTTFDDEISQPSQLVQSLMSARAKAQIEAAKPAPPPAPTENIELPDINSEYSDSEDEDRVRTFDPPEWAQSPELRQALENQKTINPDDIFGAVRPLKMEEIFKSRTSRFRARTSSANWTGTDRLTKQEESAYARRMGFK